MIDILKVLEREGAAEEDEVVVEEVLHVEEEVSTHLFHSIWNLGPDPQTLCSA